MCPRVPACPCVSLRVPACARAPGDVRGLSRGVELGGPGGFAGGQGGHPAHVPPLHRLQQLLVLLGPALNLGGTRDTPVPAHRGARATAAPGQRLSGLVPHGPAAAPPLPTPRLRRGRALGTRARHSPALGEAASESLPAPARLVWRAVPCRLRRAAGGHRHRDPHGSRDQVWGGWPRIGGQGWVSGLGLGLGLGWDWDLGWDWGQD